MKETDMRDKLCPMSFAGGESLMNCCGGNCAWWEWETSSKMVEDEYSIRPVFFKSETHGYCRACK
jgi:hypothetical protein